MKKVILTLLPCIIVLAGCYYDKEEDLYRTTCITTDVRYSNIVKPIIDASCNVAGCHNSTAAGGYNFTNFPELQRSALNGDLVGSIMHASGYSAMPQGREKLPDCQINQIKMWVDAGALNN